MKQKITFFTDVHEFGPHEIAVEWEFGLRCFYLGDNVDLSGCRKRMFAKAWQRFRFYQRMFKERFIRGNHELGNDNNDFLKYGRLLLTHGDYLFWSKARADRYRGREACVGFFTYLFHMMVFGWLLSLVSWPISRKVKERAYLLATKFNCDTVICGHWHPTKTQEVLYKGVKLIVLPRGKTTLELEV
jgi:hypothetical protein